MKSLEQYSIPIGGLNLGVHKYKFSIDKKFFYHFENSPIEQGSIDVLVIFDKRPGMITVDFEVGGYINTDCDRCLQPIKLPLKKEYQMLIKYSEEVEEEAEILYIPQETSILNVAKYIYEFIVLSIPMNKVYECELDKNAPCDEDMLKYLVQDDDIKNDNPIWGELKNLEELKSKLDPGGS